MLDPKVFATEFAGLCEVFDREASKVLTTAYYETLKDLSEEQFKKAVVNIMRSHKFSKLPLPAEIIESSGANNDTALIALDKAERAISKHGSYCAVVFDDPVIHMVISSMGGWAKFCCPSAYGDDQEWHWKQKEFIALYETYSKNPRGEVPKVLVGIGDTSYERSDGMRVLIEPKYVGDKQKAIEWTHRDSPAIEGNIQETGFAISGLLVKSM